MEATKAKGASAAALKQLEAADKLIFDLQKRILPEVGPRHKVLDPC